jgi:hypothetical protein
MTIDNQLDRILQVFHKDVRERVHYELLGTPPIPWTTPSLEPPGVWGKILACLCPDSLHGCASECSGPENTSCPKAC